MTYPYNNDNDRDVEDYIKEEKRKQKAKIKRELKEKRNDEYITIGGYEIQVDTFIRIKKLAIILGLSLAIGGGSIIVTNALKEDEVIVEEEKNPLKDFYTIVYEVSYGDNLWNLAKKSLPDGATEGDIATKVKEIRNDNGLFGDNDILSVGKKIIIDVEGEKLPIFGQIYDPSYQWVSVNDQISDKLNYLKDLEYNMKLSSTSFQNIEHYEEFCNSIYELEREYNNLKTRDDLGDEERMLKENEALELIKELLTDARILFGDDLPEQKVNVHDLPHIQSIK